MRTRTCLFVIFVLLLAFSSCTSQLPVKTANITGEWDLVTELCTFTYTDTYYKPETGVYTEVVRTDTLINYQYSENYHVHYSIKADSTCVRTIYSSEPAFETEGKWFMQKDTVTCLELKCQVVNLTADAMVWVGRRYYAPSIGVNNAQTTLTFRRTPQ